ncbi:MAG TPA: histidine kinase [Acidimicrobiales bacterium]|nr:histidine kinase [Acidimicrobiales bacterium]
MTTTMDVPLAASSTGVGVAPSGRRLASLAMTGAVLVAAGWAATYLSDVPSDDVPLQAIRIGLVAVWGLVGGALAVRRPREPLGLLVLAGTLVGGSAVVASAALRAGHGGTVGELVRALAVGILPAVALHVVAVLPDGRLARPSHRTVLIGFYVASSAVGVVLASARPDLPLWIVAVEAMLAAVIAVSVSNARYVRTRGVARQRMQWFGLAVTLAVEVMLVAVALRIFLDWPHPLAEIATAATVLVPLSFVPCLFHRLLGHVDRLLGGAVSLTGLTGVVVSVYLVIVLGLGRSPTDDERTILLLSMVAAAVAAILYAPARVRLARVSNQLVYGERHAPDEALRTFGARLTRAIPFDELLLQLAESLRKSLALQAAEVWAGSAGHLERVVSVPQRGSARLDLTEDEQPVVARARVSGSAWLQVWLPRLLEDRGDAAVRMAPITHGGELLGFIVVQRPAEAERFSDADESVLAELARQVGLALHNLQLDSALQESLRELQRRAEELRASRSRVVAAADAERRKIERNLHDGAQQHLVALAVTVRLAQQLASTDPGQARELLEQLGHDLQEAVQELRDLAHGIYPPVLIDRGLVAALESAATRAALPVEVVADGDVGRFPQDVEAAVYFCCLEALQNAGKHAGEGAVATVTIARQPDPDGRDRLTFTVADNGSGFDPAALAGRGHGFVNMSDRLGAIGGNVEVDSAPGRGTRVSGTVPVDGQG